MSYYENRIKELEHRIEEMARANRLKAIPVEAQLIDRIVELNKEKARLEAENERLRKAGDALSEIVSDTPMGTCDSLLVALKVLDWNAAKEGKPSV